VILSFVALAIVVPTTIAIILAVRGSEAPNIIFPDDERTGGRGVVLTPDNVRDILDEMNKIPDDASYTCSMSTEWTFVRWDTPSSDVYVDNHIDNTRMVYFEVYLDDENGNAILEELIYSSPFLQVGASLRNFALDKHVPAGEYSATVVYYLADDDYNVVADVSVGIRLIIKN
jgi:hypothetical protein